MVAGSPAPRIYRLPGYDGFWASEEEGALVLRRGHVLSERERADLEAARLRSAQKREAQRRRVVASPALIGTDGFGPRNMAILRATEADDLALIAAARRGGGA